MPPTSTALAAEPAAPTVEKSASDPALPRSASPLAAAQRGYRFLTTKVYLPPDFDQQTFDELWRTWEEPLRSQAEKASVVERRKMAFSRYGLTLRPEDAKPRAAAADSHGRSFDRPLQYVVDERGNWSMNCFACHGGQVTGKDGTEQVVPGLPNARFALETLTEEVRATKLRLNKPLAHMDIGSLFMPLGTSDGTTNAVMFGVALMAARDADLNVRRPSSIPKMTHHDMDAPPWWHFKKRNRLYIDGFEAKHHRPLMQFLLVKQNGPKQFRAWEADFKDIYAYLESIQPPKYPFEVDRRLAAQGESVFARHCAECHGTYGEKWTYPNKTVPIDVVGTDRVRLDALLPEHRNHYGMSWFGDYGRHKAIDRPEGYVAPPLDGVWASAPYFHNGSAPTLWHVLHPKARPAVWSPNGSGYDREKVGLDVTTYDRVPDHVKSAAQRRHYFDTRRSGKSNAGHLFPDELDENEKRAVLELLKTL
jgi:mono/diheme cytochrome c family protein